MTSAALRRAALLGMAVAAVLLWALIPTYPNYDAYHHLNWGRELLDGMSPGFEEQFAPTQHPLFLLVGAVLGLAGEHADRLLVLLTILAHGLFVAGVFALARAVFGELAAWLAALLAGSSFALLLYASRAYVDIPFLALVFWAAALLARAEAQRRRADGSEGIQERQLADADARPVLWAMALLAVAGLLRPEAWLLSGALWVWRGRRWPATLPLLIAGPLVWALLDLLVTGDPLFSVRSTSDLADELNRPRGIDEVPSSFVRFIADTAREPVAVIGVAGAMLGWRDRNRLPGLYVPVALFAAGAIAFAGTGLAGLSILPRYLTVPAVALCLFAAYALTRHKAILALTIAAALCFAVLKVGTFERLASELRFGRAVHADLVHMLDDPRIRTGMQCGTISFPTYRLVPEARWHLDAGADVVGSRASVPPRSGVAIVVTGEKSTKRYGQADGVERATNLPPQGWRRGPQHGRFVSYLRC